MLANARRERYARLMSLRYYDSPVGRLALQADGDALAAVRRAGEDERSSGAQAAPLLKEAMRQLDRFSPAGCGASTCRSPQAAPSSRKEGGAMMSAIPFGETATYGGMAMALGSGARAVGTACGRNPLPIVVPCHRVLGSGGSIGGFSRASGLPTKRQLLALEGVVLL